MLTFKKLQEILNELKDHKCMNDPVLVKYKDNYLPISHIVTKLTDIFANEEEELNPRFYLMYQADWKEQYPLWKQKEGDKLV